MTTLSESPTITHLMLTRLWRKALQVLDRPGRRGLLIGPGSIWTSFTYRTPCLVYWRDGTWIHHYRGGKIPHASLGRAALLPSRRRFRSGRFRGGASR